MANASPAKRGVTAGLAATVSVVLWTTALALVLAYARFPWRSAMVVGLVCALLSGTTGMLATVMTEGQSLNAALLGRAVSFLVRMMLLAGGLIVTIRILNAQPLGFVLMYFPLFFLSSLLEQLVSWSMRTEKTPAAPSAPGGAR